MVIIVEVTVESHEQRGGDNLPAYIPVSKLMLTYFSTQAHRREIKSEETLGAVVNVTVKRSLTTSVHILQH